MFRCRSIDDFFHAKNTQPLAQLPRQTFRWKSKITKVAMTAPRGTFALIGLGETKNQNKKKTFVITFFSKEYSQRLFGTLKPNRISECKQSYRQCGQNFTELLNKLRRTKTIQLGKPPVKGKILSTKKRQDSQDRQHNIVKKTWRSRYDTILLKLKKIKYKKYVDDSVYSKANYVLFFFSFLSVYLYSDVHWK